MSGQTAPAADWRRRAVRVIVLVVAVGFLVWAVQRQWTDFSRALTHLHVGSVLLALGAVLVAQVLNLLSWRSAMAAVGAHLPFGSAARVFFLSQLGKYVPGSVWPVLAQMELTRESGVPRARGALGAVVGMVVGVVASATVGAVLLVLPEPDVRARYGWVLAVLPVAVVVLAPPVLSRLLGVLVRLTRRDPVDTSLDGRALLRSVGWSTLMWFAFGAQAWVLANDLAGADGPGLLTAVGAFALAWVVGFLVVLSPAGLGAREAALVVALGAALVPADALALALVSRVVMTAGDGLAALSVLPGGRAAQLRA